MLQVILKHSLNQELAARPWLHPPESPLAGEVLIECTVVFNSDDTWARPNSILKAEADRAAHITNKRINEFLRSVYYHAHMVARLDVKATRIVCIAGTSLSLARSCHWHA